MPEVADSILLSVKKLNNVVPEYTAFDNDFIMYINSGLFDLAQVGVVFTENFHVEDENDEWDDLMDESHIRDSVKTYLALNVRLFFDPPPTSFTQQMMKDQLTEKAWQLKAAQEDLDREEAEA